MGRPERLGSLEAAFVELERQGTPFVIGAVLLFERAPLASPDGALDLGRVREVVAAAIDRLPRYRQRLGRAAVLGHPVWVDDERFDLDRHLRFTALPASTMEELYRLVGRLLSEDLPPEHPPWQLVLADGVPGDRVALVAMVHHSLVDGVAGVALLGRILKLASDDRAPEAAWEPAPPPRGRRLLLAELRHRLAGLRALRGAIRGRGLLRGLASLVGEGLRGASDAGLNRRRVGRDRIFAGSELDLGEVKGIKNHFGTTVNDVALAVVTGALRRFLARRGVDVDRLEKFRAMVPANTRALGDESAGGTRVSLLLVDLPVDEPDPRRRLERVHQTTRALKESSSQVAAGELLVRMSDVTSPRILSGVLALALARRAFNVVVTNVPGPPVPLYLRASRMTAFYPIVNLWPGGGLGIALLSYAGTLYVGLHGDPQVVGYDLAPLTSDILESFAELRALARARPTPVERPAPQPPLHPLHPE